MQVEAKGYLFPSLKGMASIVVSAKQGQSPVSNEDSALVPVGVPALQAEGSQEVPDIQHREKNEKPFDHSADYRGRIFTLQDISASMNEDSGNKTETKLGYVQGKIVTLNKELACRGIRDIEHILIQYDDIAQIIVKTRSTEELLNTICRLRTRGGTNFVAAFQAVLDEINQNPNNEARNLIILISDGEHNVGPFEEVLQRAALFPKIDCGIYIVGVGPDYNETHLKDILKVAGFGGLTHIPNKGRNIFSNLLPSFIAEMRSAPYYPIVSFSSYFKNIINMQPSVREVLEQNFERSLQEYLQEQGLPNATEGKHFPAVMGYQLNGYSVGFANEVAIESDKAKIYLIVKIDSNGKPLLVEEVPVIPINEAILDPQERRLIEKAHIDARLIPVLEKRNPEELRAFINQNKDKLNRDQIKQLDQEVRNLKNPDRTAESESESRGTVSDFAASFTEESFRPSFSNPPLSGNQFSQVPSSDEPPSFSPPSSQAPELHSGPVGPLSQLPLSSIPPVEGPADINPQAYGKVPPLLEFTIQGVGESAARIPKTSYELQDDTKSLTFGRSRSSDVIYIPGTASMSRQHFEIYLKGNDLYIRDLNSRNGTFVNDKAVTDDKKLSNGDLIRVGNVTLKIEY